MDDLTSSSTTTTTTSSSNTSEQLHQRKQKGNLSLCRSTNAQELCLGMGKANANANANNSGVIITMNAKQESLEAIATASVVQDKDRYSNASQDNDSNDTRTSTSTSTSSNNALDWFYKDGLLRAVDRDGYAHDTLCLGPKQGVTHLDGSNAHQPYELVLQDCPSSSSSREDDTTSSSSSSSSNTYQSHASSNDRNSDSNSNSISINNNNKENIFLHNISYGTTPRRSDERPNGTIRAKSTVVQREPEPEHQEPEHQEPEQQQDQRHMRFLVQGDGLIRSLAPVYNNQEKDLIDVSTTKPFCVTTTNESNENSIRAYLIPCLDDIEHHIYTFGSGGDDATNTNDKQYTERVSQQQQLFHIDERSSFESFLVHLHSTSTSTSTSTTLREDNEDFVQLAYQIGYHGPSCPERIQRKGILEIHSTFDSFAIQVESSNAYKAEGEGEEQHKTLFETTLPSQFSSDDTSTIFQSGLVSCPVSSLLGSITTIGSNPNSNSENTMNATLMGRIRNTTNTNTNMQMLASTSFEVPIAPPPLPPPSAVDNDALSKDSIALPWGHILFWGFLLTYAILIKAHAYFYPKRHNKWKTQIRESVISVDTLNSTAARGSYTNTNSPGRSLDLNHWRGVRTGSFSSNGYSNTKANANNLNSSSGGVFFSRPSIDSLEEFIVYNQNQNHQSQYHQNSSDGIDATQTTVNTDDGHTMNGSSTVDNTDLDVAAITEISRISTSHNGFYDDDDDNDDDEATNDIEAHR